MKAPTQAEMMKAIRRIARSSDGMMLYRFLQIELMHVEHATDVGALYRNEGRRSLARELKAVMDDELSNAEPLSAGRPGPNHDPDEPLIDARRKPVDVDTGHRGAERRRTGYEPKPGDD